MLLRASKAPEWLGDAVDDRDVFLTDGLRLFRLIGTMALGEGRCARLEDCYTLRETLHTEEELWKMQLRAVGRTAPTRV